MSSQDTQRPESSALPDTCGTVDLGHWALDAAGDLRVCVLRHDCHKTSRLDFLFMFGETLSLTLEAPRAGSERAEPHEHPRIDLHVNAGGQYGHDWCVVVDACAVCSSDLWPLLFEAQVGALARHLTDEDRELIDELVDRPDSLSLLLPGRIEGNVLTRPFILTRPDEARAALRTVVARAHSA